jgi:hypothetical protein
MKPPNHKTTAWLLCLTTSCSAYWTSALTVAAEESDSSAAISGKVKFAAARPQLDTTQTPKIKPFTLGASQVSVQAGTQDQAQNQAQNQTQNQTQSNPLKADTRFTTDPFGQPPLTSGVNSNRFNLQASDAVRLLAKYNVQLLVDRSCSMGQRDCPNGLSRWQWCGEQASSLARAISPLVPHGLTIVPFATQYDVFDNASAQNIESLFNTMHLQSGTRLYEPLAEQFDTYFANHAAKKKPLLVVVITDGVPVPRIEPILVRQELVAASNRQKSPQEVTVIFCQIGSQDAKGQAYLTDLDQNLGQYGARYDIVHTITFDDLQQFGLGPALANSLQKYAPAPAPAPEPVKAAHSQIAKARTPGVAPGRHTHLARGGAG